MGAVHYEWLTIHGKRAVEDGPGFLAFMLGLLEFIIYNLEFTIHYLQSRLHLIPAFHTSRNSSSLSPK